MTPNDFWSTTNSVELSSISTISTLAMNNPMRFMFLCSVASTTLAFAAAAAVARARIGGGGRQHLLHRLQVQPVARDCGSALVLGQHRTKALRIAVGLRDHALAVTLRLLAQPRRRATRLGQDVAGVGLAFVLQPIAVGAGLHRVVERRLHLLGHLHV